jgi:hypothetical protein
MSDKKSLDLETAQQLYIAAGQPDQARAAGFVIDAVRNTVQGEWGIAFVNALDGLLIKHIDPLSEQIGGLRGDNAALQAEFRAGLSGVQASVSDLAETLNEHSTRLDAHAARLATLEETQTQHGARLDAHDRILKTLADWRARLDEWRKQLTP